MILTRRMLLGASLTWTFAPAWGAMPSPTPAQVLAPTGRLRFALYRGSPVTVIQGDPPQSSKGVGFDLGRELARRLGVPFEPVVYPTPAAVMAALDDGAWDATVLAATPDRRARMDMSAAFLAIEQSYLVPPGSPIARLEQVDQPGVKLGAPQGGSVQAVLARIIRNATVSAIPGLEAAADALRAGQIDAFAANKANLAEVSDKVPGSKILDGSIGLDEYGLGVPKDRKDGMPYLEQYVRAAKADGIIDAAIRRAGLRGALMR